MRAEPTTIDDATASGLRTADARILLPSHRWLRRAQGMNLPLHHAAMNKASETVIKALLDAYPKGAKEKGQVCGRGAPTPLNMFPRPLRAAVSRGLFTVRWAASAMCVV